jgi:uncharacterized membrane protein YeaQ/YmgE (transglycosylase-associated protein family)
VTWGVAPDTVSVTVSSSCGEALSQEEYMHLIGTIIIGLIVGAIAKFIMPGKDPGGIIITILIGIAGSFIGTYLGQMIGHYQDGQTAGFIMSLIGACILLGIYHLVRRMMA